MDKVSFKYRVIALAAVPLAVMAASGMAFSGQLAEIEELHQRREVLGNTLASVHRLDKGVRDMEGQRRSYALSRKPEFEREYLAAETEFKQALAVLVREGTGTDEEKALLSEVTREFGLWSHERAAPRPVLAEASALRADVAALLSYELEQRQALTERLHRLSEEGQTRTAWTVGVGMLIWVVLVGVFLRRRIELLSAQNQQLQKLQEVSEALMREPGLERMVPAALETTLAAYSASFGALYMFEPDEQLLRLMHEVGLPPGIREEVERVPVGAAASTLVAQAAFQRRMFSERDVPCLPGPEEVRSRLERTRCAGCVAAPIVAGDRVLGAMIIGRATPFGEAELASLQLVARQLGFAIEKARAFRTLQELDRLRNDFVANVSHELRTPLTAIKGASDLMLSGVVGELPPPQRAFATMIDQNAERLSHLIHDLLDIAKMEAGQMRFNRSVHALGPLLAAASSPWSERIELSVPEDLAAAPLLVDGEKLQQVLRHLLQNAVKFSPADAAIRLTARPRPGFVEVTVEDRGIGIAPELRDQLFHKFVQVSPSLTRRTRGAGLGLALCRRIIEAHGGHITVKSEPGCGSTFTFTVPLAPESELADPMSPSPAA